ncbi:unnamed protein product [Protopolystoma xenopodis]|uniref:Secreted protein n=1 Tax=Protopolystoma xenopodis TaxID=117903 RepID=A0A448X3C1_9PLAT|nr:unnamed protein product [Protopolystoma xenopodis]
MIRPCLCSGLQGGCTLNSSLPLLLSLFTLTNIPYQSDDGSHNGDYDTSSIRKCSTTSSRSHRPWRYRDSTSNPLRLRTAQSHVHRTVFASAASVAPLSAGNPTTSTVAVDHAA